MKVLENSLRIAASWLPEREVTKIFPEFEMRLNKSQFIDFKILYLSFEPHAIADIKRLVKPGMTAIPPQSSTCPS